MSSPSAEDLHRRLIDQVAEFRTSEAWLAAMTTAARFHEYSLGNWLLMWAEADQRGTKISRPAGYRTWQRLGRQVRKGERGYRILAPMTRRLPTDGAEDETRRILTGFRVVTVFDVDQTEGEALAEAGPRVLTGAGHADLLAATVEMIEARGYTFQLGRLRGPNGLTRPTRREVIVEESLEDAQVSKTAVHELAHVLMHADTTEIDCRERVEVEAESVAYVVCSAAGLDTSAYSVAYVAGWAESAPDAPRLLLATAERVVTTSRHILDHLDGMAALAS